MSGGFSETKDDFSGSYLGEVGLIRWLCSKRDEKRGIGGLQPETFTY